MHRDARNRQVQTEVETVSAVPDVQVRARQVAIYALPGDGGGLLAVHARAPRRGSYVVDQAHWDGLPGGHTRAVTAGGPVPPASRPAAVRPDRPIGWGCCWPHTRPRPRRSPAPSLPTWRDSIASS